MENKKVKKIVILGPESTGKSTISEQLAAHYKTLWAKEYAREYLETYGTDYSYEDLYTIALGQIKGEDDAFNEMQNNFSSYAADPFLFIDTDLHVIKVWSEFVFNKCDNRVLSGIVQREYDLYLLCDTDLPWVKDNLREYPDLETRDKLFHFYKEEMTEQEKPWVIINGNYEERLERALAAVEKFLR